ncbi:DNA primase [Arenimonas caeni]|jgi:DNA primase|uniref:DNA primase n=1 Tax=Arenimonas caeni TaxID=2058085 RepID=A0A2P6M8M6_9GAMM|nr:DNA primase [Arenimonas caeni]MDY0022452.1 DNA primase [Arenimonas caeni]PRH82347.1 DNA primase [Arenimonas caeni]
MARIPDAFIDDLLARTDIVEVVGSRVPLKRQGREYSARCPFHDERSPSFTVSPTKQFYHCFGCGAHGTAISFLMNYDRLEFLDAVEELAKRAGMEVPRDTRQRNESGESRDLYGAVDAAARYFQQQLRESSKARAYLERRGVDADNQARFGIGYAPDGWEGLKSALGTDERRLALLEKVGLFSRNDAGRVYDKFRDRVMFPIHDRRGRVIAFGGRVLEKDDGPKYLNSPETPLFHKGRELYGLWQVRQAHAKIPRLVVVEGYMDVVALFQYGVNTAVATLGTATTPDHAELLFRNAADVYFCFDGDRAGRGAAWKALESVLPRMRDGRQAFFLFLPEGEDPDTIVRKEGAAGFDARLATATPLSEFFYAELSKDVNLAGMEGKARLAERAKPLLAGIPDGAFRDLMLQRLTELTGVGRREEAAAPARPAPSMRPARGGAPAPKRSLVRTAIALLLQKPTLAEAIEPPYLFGALRQPGIPLLVELVQLAKSRPGITTGAVLEHFAEREEGAALQKLALQAFPGDEAGWRAEIVDALAQLDRQVRAQRVEELQARIREAGSASLSDAEKTELRDLLTSK